MSIYTPVQGEIFRVRCSSYHKLNPSKKWSNNLALETTINTTQEALDTFARRFATFMSMLTHVNIVTERVIISTFVQDTNPYDGNEFMTVEIGVSGEQTFAGDNLLPLEAALYVRKQTLSGRAGKLFIRGALSEGEVEFGQTLFTFSNRPAMELRINLAAQESGLSQHFFGNGSDLSMVIEPARNQQLGPRNVVDLDASGVVFVNMNKRYYDRT